MNEAYLIKRLPAQYSPRISLRIYLRRLLILLFVLNINVLIYVLYNITFGHIADLSIKIKLPIFISMLISLIFIIPTSTIINWSRFKYKSYRINLQRKVAAYKEALNNLKREEAPQKWANAQYELASALRDLGEIEINIQRRLTSFPSLNQLEACTYLREADTAYKEAVKGLPPDAVPQKWTNAQHELANVLGVIARRWGKAGVLALVMGTAGVLFASMFLAWADLQYITLTYQISAAQETQKQLLDLNRKLRIEYSKLTAISRLEKLAAQYGMGPPQPSQIIKDSK